MSGHSPEPWKFSIDADGRVNIFVDDGRVVTLCHAHLRPEDARRIVACVNACDGIDTDLIEPRMLGDQIAAKMAVIEKCDRLNTENAALNDYCATVEQQRDRLLSVLKMFAELDACDGQRDRLAEFDAKHGVGDKGRYSFFFGAARTAIAEVEGSGHEPV